MQARALRANGERQDERLGRSPEKPSSVPKLNLAALASLAAAKQGKSPQAAAGRLGRLFQQAQKATSPPHTSPAKPSPAKRSTGGRKARGGKLGAMLLPDLPSIAGSSEDDGDDSASSEA